MNKVTSGLNMNFYVYFQEWKTYLVSVLISLNVKSITDGH